MAKAKQVSSKPGSTKDSLRKTLRAKVAHKKVFSTRSNTKKPASGPSKKKPSKRSRGYRQPKAEPPFPFSNQPDYLAWAGDRIDHKRVKRDEERERRARKDALEELRARPPTNQRSFHMGCVVDDHSLIEVLGLGRSKEARDIYLSSFTRKAIAELKSPYPPMFQYAAESEAAKAHWESVCHYTPVRDIRSKPIDWYPTMRLDLTKMTVVRANESVIFYDPQSPEKPVLLVLRGLVQDEAVRKAIGEMVLKAIVERRRDRREDTGAIVPIGYTAGARNEKKMGMARNQSSLIHKADVRRCEREDQENGSLMALLWNIMRHSLPEGIIADYDTTIAAHNLDRLSTGSNKGFEVMLDDGKYRFSSGALAPPTALAGWNYARYTHNDHNANEYMISYTSHCNADPSRGGNFYVAKYGIYVEQAANTCVAWKEKDPHGTTIIEPVRGRQNFGVSVAIANTLVGARAKAAKRAADGGEARS
ncbi:hypothetical protein GJ744_000328 [Endocarpon pusillum]|uniref:Uncharacterized protein n=1 Tax=Endocarpon pusillum TaxID=364733 RepID=A0A8H7ATA1_9EURO|nr:hypothetical protein GJ744_000328 [Endocarpon pusillum]